MLKNKPMSNVCGEKIRELRREREMSQEKLAEKMREIIAQQIGEKRFNRHSIMEIEDGTRCITDYELLYVAHIFKVPVSELFPEMYPD